MMLNFFLEELLLPCLLSGHLAGSPAELNLTDKFNETKNFLAYG
jgi:hypothetical protein